jgi:hypothetical protein
MAAIMRPVDDLDEDYRLGDVSPAERRLEESRARIEQFLIPPPNQFPRSQTMRFLTGRNGKAAALGAALALYAVKPRLAATLMKFLPVGRLMRRFL